MLAMAAVLSASCAAAPRSGETGSSRNQLSSVQLAAANATNLYEAIVKLRPEWLSSRGPTSVTDATPTSADVFMNGSMLGKADYLKQLNAVDVAVVRYYDAASASARFGMGHPRGVIEISTK